MIDGMAARVDQHRLVLHLIGREPEQPQALTQRLLDRTAHCGRLEIAELAASELRLLGTRAWLRDVGHAAPHPDSPMRWIWTTPNDAPCGRSAGPRLLRECRGQGNFEGPSLVVHPALYHCANEWIVASPLFHSIGVDRQEVEESPFLVLGVDPEQ